MSSPTARRKSDQPPDSFDVTASTVVLNVLGYREDGEWIALALEMDLRGYGDTFREDLQDLRDLVSTQIGFAQFKAQPDLVWRPAEPVWFERFADARRERLNALVHARELSDPSYDVAGEKPEFVKVEP